MDNGQDKITEFNLRKSIAVAVLFLFFIEVLFALPDLLRPAFPLGYKRAALILAIGLAVGTVMGVVFTVLLRRRISRSLVIPMQSWHRDVGLGILFLLWVVVPNLLSRMCFSLWQEEIKSRTASPAISDCFVNVQMVGRFSDGLVWGVLIWTYLWAFVYERNREGQLVVALHSRKRWSIRGWPITDVLMVVGFGLFLIYMFYRIFTLK